MIIKQLHLAILTSLFIAFSVQAQEVVEAVKKDSIVTATVVEVVKKDSTITADAVPMVKKDSTTVAPIKQDKYKSWSVQFFVGQPLIYASFLDSDFISDIGKTYDFQLGVTKNISHAIGIQLLGNIGQTKQYAYLSNKNIYAGTKYHSIALMGDVNLSALARKTDYSNSKFYKWALHLYAGIGTIGYTHNPATTYKLLNYVDGVDDAKLFQRSYFGQGALGLRRRLNQSLDVELKQTIMVTNDASFDGTNPSSIPFQSRANNSYNGGNMFITSLGVHYKIGKRGNEHLVWVDPFISLRSEIDKAVTAAKICQVDGDGDAVCDEWDRELTTPAGARVDGSGVALDVDLDKVIDLFDKCVTIPGEGNPTGCPDKLLADNSVLKDKLASINLALEGIDFDLNSAVIKPQYFAVLDQAAFVMQEFPGYKFKIEGHTDAQGSNYYNYVLSKKRAESVKTYLVDKQKLSPDRLTIVPKGETDLKNVDCQPHTKCDEAKNRENRRIVFIPEG